MGLTLKEGNNAGNSSASGMKIRPSPLEDCTNHSVVKFVPLRTWKKIARLSQQSDVNKQPSNLERRLEIDPEEVTFNKRQCMDFSYSHYKENFEVVAGSQHHRA